MRELGSGDILYILGAVRWTLLLSVVAFIGGSAGGVLVALARTSDFRWLRWIAAGYIKVFQGTPLLMQLFLAFFAPGIFGFSVDPWTAAALGAVPPDLDTTLGRLKAELQTGWSLA